ncbi:hypothetical protein Hanom_Chr08g00703801 [Helianthus anomalus]
MWKEKKVPPIFFVDLENVSPNVEGCCLGLAEVGSEKLGGFKIGSGNRSRKTFRRSLLGSFSVKAQNRSTGNKVASPGEIRPKKRSRSSGKDEEPGFGFVDFASRSNIPLDLNIRAQSSGTLAEDSLV